ncbi:MAG: hypothetical protein JXA92_04950 [candidate division Zixibacteria bacterium]|nr:hypothetical protein [candidate division Zixibacteria bacterium]
MSGAIVPLIAATTRQRQMREEERMTCYNKNDLEGWEFKIVRSQFGSFRNPENIEKLCREEARAGWEMLEKFDDYRIRFKRCLDKRAMDRFAEIDPYRTGYETGLSAVMWIIITITLLGVGLGLFFLAANR